MTTTPKVRVDVYDEADLQRELEKARDLISLLKVRVEVLKSALDVEKSRANVLADPATMFALIAADLEATGRSRVPGVGTFYATTRKARRVRNPVTKELMMLPETKSVRFKPSKGGVFG